MKTEEEINKYRGKTAKEIHSIDTIIERMRERIEIPVEAQRVGFEEYMLMLMTKKATLEIIADTLDWVREDL